MAERPPQIARHRLRVLIALLRQLFERLIHDHRHGRADLGLLLDGLGRLHQVHHRDGNRRLPLERHMAAEHFVENHADGV